MQRKTFNCVYCMNAKKKRGWAGDDESNCGLAYHTDRNDKPVDSEVLVVSTEGGEAVVAPDTVTG